MQRKLTFNFISTSVRQRSLTMWLICAPFAEIGIASDKFYGRMQSVFHRKRIIPLPQLARYMALVRVDVRLHARLDEGRVSSRSIRGTKRHIAAQAEPIQFFSRP
jgi:hypothetical protein